MLKKSGLFFKVLWQQCRARPQATDVFIAIVLKCCRWNLLIFIGLRYLCNVFIF